MPLTGIGVMLACFARFMSVTQVPVLRTVYGLLTAPWLQ